ncbi:MAG: DNA methyltransferase [Thermacetogeniaceae bacterium]
MTIVNNMKGSRKQAGGHSSRVSGDTEISVEASYPDGMVQDEGNSLPDKDSVTKNRSQNGIGATSNGVGGEVALPVSGKPRAIAGTVATELDGKTWLRYSISIWGDLAKNREERSLRHPAMFPSSLTDRLLEIFSPRDGGLVMDPFMGSGSTICSAYRRGLPAVGFELSLEYIALARQRLAEIPGAPGPRPRLIQESSERLLAYLAPDSVGLCVTSPPYWDVLRQRRTADGKQVRHYGEDCQDLGRIGSYEEFLAALQEVFTSVYQALRPGAYCIVVVMDVRKKNRLYPLHLDLAQRLFVPGFILDDIIIWDRRQEYNRLKPLGYPHVFRVNKVHEYILIFQKR